ncbi:NADH-quinone oxidoreductase subunit L, partial [bacterium]|nr:NADH-quinone oxidoreductase subunit L [bacterium]
MLELLWLVPTLPFLGFLILTVTSGRLGRRPAAWIGVGSIGLATLVALAVTIGFFGLPEEERAFDQVLWTWLSVGGFNPSIGFHLDALSLIMMLVVAGVGFLIHLYSAEFMQDDEGHNRFFSYMNLFVGSMLVLVLADNLLFLYFGWEGVGLCSYLLIGFWYKDPVNGRAARKAFVVTRIGDTGMAIGLFLLFDRLGTLHIQEMLIRAQEQWPVGSTLAIAAAALLLIGAIGKSGQLPLQVWLPDAMAGPTPVSALIHAATMVTAGVYLIARTNVLFTLAPPVQLAVAIIGALTLLIAGFAALAQHDIKRILAYSTISQIGYMFLALGVGAWSAAMFHFMTHAFFKALLFLAAGVAILAVHHEHSIFKMGGLRKHLPVTFWTFLLGAASLAALPFVTAGFYSKDLILYRVWQFEHGGHILYA